MIKNRSEINHKIGPKFVYKKSIKNRWKKCIDLESVIKNGFESDLIKIGHKISQKSIKKFTEDLFEKNQLEIDRKIEKKIDQKNDRLGIGEKIAKKTDERLVLKKN